MAGRNESISGANIFWPVRVSSYLAYILATTPFLPGVIAICSACAHARRTRKDLLQAHAGVLFVSGDVAIISLPP